MTDRAAGEVAGAIADLDGLSRRTCWTAADGLAPGARPVPRSRRRRPYLQSNRFEGVWYFSKERFEILVRLLLAATPFRAPCPPASRRIAPHQAQRLLVGARAAAIVRSDARGLAVDAGRPESRAGLGFGGASRCRTHSA